MRAYRHAATARFYNRVVALVTKLPFPPVRWHCSPSRAAPPGFPDRPRLLSPRRVMDGFSSPGLTGGSIGSRTWSAPGEGGHQARLPLMSPTPLPVEEASKVLRDSLAARGTMLRRMLSPISTPASKTHSRVAVGGVTEHPVFMLEAA